MIRAKEEGFRDSCGKRGLAEFRQLGQVLLPDALSQPHVAELALAAHVDKAGVGKLFEMMRAGSGGDAQPAARVAAAQLAVSRDALQDAVALRVGDGFTDVSELLRGHTHTLSRRDSTRP